MSHLKSSAQTMRIVLWSWEGNEGNKTYLKMPPSIHKASCCNNIPWDRRCIYFCHIPSYFGVIKANSFACPRNQKKQSRCSSDLFLIHALVRVSLTSVTYSTGRTKYGFSYSSRFAPSCFVAKWYSAISVPINKHMFRDRPQNLQPPNCHCEIQNGCCRLVLGGLSCTSNSDGEWESTASRRLLLPSLASANP